MKIAHSKRFTKSVIALLATLALAGAFLAWHYLQPKPSNSDLYGSESTNPVPNTPIATSNNTGSTSNTKEASGETPTVDASVTPRTPSGVFVSHHRPNLSGTPVSNSLASTCTTTPGAYCTVRFSNGSVTKELPEKQTDGDGNVSWTWSLQEIGLTSGTWNVTGVARNGSNKATANDAVPLTVEP